MNPTYVPPVRRMLVHGRSGTIAGPIRACLDDEFVVSLPLETVLPLGMDLDLMVSGGRLARPMDLQGTVRRRIEVKGSRLYGVAHQAGELRGYSLGCSSEERRRWPRVPVQVPTPERVPVLLQAGDIQVAGFLIDVSAGGVAVRMAWDREGAMSEHETAVVIFIPPGSKTQVRRSCRIRSRLLGEDGLRYGIRFDVPDVSVQYEALWTCENCGQEGLLAESQCHCPDCGRVRGEAPSYMPEWERLVSVLGHRFTGVDTNCAACGALWSTNAAHCGRCGTSLIANDTSGQSLT